MPGAAEVLDSLLSGEYLLDVVAGPDPKRDYYVVYSTEGLELGSFSSDYPVQLSPDLKYLEALPDLVSMTTGEVLHFEGVNSCGRGTWSPDRRSIIAECNDTNTSEDDLFLLSLDNLSAKRLECSGHATLCTEPAWSPDGKWIAYYYIVQAGGGSYPIEGLHLMDTHCFSSPTTCVATGDGIDGNPHYTWSPDGRYLAVNDADYITAYIVEGRNPAVSMKYRLPSSINRIAWSPSGKWIAADTEDGVYLVSTATGEASAINIRGFIYWISVP
jgi:Tol biopolymer transport system component